MILAVLFCIFKYFGKIGMLSNLVDEKKVIIIYDKINFIVYLSWYLTIERCSAMEVVISKHANAKDKELIVEFVKQNAS